MNAHLRDLVMGARLSFAGGREGLLRTAMTALGVGLGVALLLLAASLPGILSHRDARIDAREPVAVDAAPAANTLQTADVRTVFRGTSVRGVLLHPDGPRAPVPPGLTAVPAPGEAVVSPALHDLLHSADGELLRPRVPYRIVGSIGDDGLAGPTELVYYAGSGPLDAETAARVTAFGQQNHADPFSPTMILLVVVIFVVLLLPVAVFVAAAVRFGGDQRDRRLAALRLVGADTAMTRRIATGEVLAAAGLGLLVGVLFFLAGRHLAELTTVADISLFAGDIQPHPLLALLVGLVVPALAVVVTLVGLRGVVIEPLGVVRRAATAHGRLWWRLLVPAAGLALLYPMIGRPAFDPYQTAVALVLLLVGVVVLLPWLVGVVVSRLRGGPVAWQLAVRRLQLNAGSHGRVAGGIAVAVTGAIALQLLFTGVEPLYRTSTGVDLAVADMMLYPAPAHAAATRKAVTAVPGVTGVVSVARSSAAPVAGASTGTAPYDMLVGDCANLRHLADLPSCRDGDVFLTPPDGDGYPVPRPGDPVVLDAIDKPWRVPADARRLAAARAADGSRLTGLLVTTGALPAARLATLRPTISLRAGSPDTQERVRNAVARVEPTTMTSELTTETTTTRFADIRRGLFIGALATLTLIGLSLLVGVLEQLRERRRLLAVLAAFGTRRSTLGWSVLWQTGVPIVLGLAVAVPGGIGLGAVLLAMVGQRLRVDAVAVLTMSGPAAAVVLLVTALSLPALWRLMRADGLRTE